MKLTFSRSLAALALLSLSVAVLCVAEGKAEARAAKTFDADNKNIQYTGRIDFSDPKKPKFWSPGVYIKARFQGSSCDVLVNDEVLWGHSQNYLEIAIDNQKPFRVQTTGAVNTIHAATGLSHGAHTITICKDTESGIGYLQFLGLRCDGLQRLPAQPKRKLEFIGDSITCGAGSDLSTQPCGKGQWYDQHNAYMSYGATTARNLGAQWMLSSVSGIGLMHSCCDMKETMPMVFDKLSVRDGTGPWDFSRYQPDAVTICLGQNDGAQDPTQFRKNYVAFIEQVRGHYPKAQIVLLTSPMGDAHLTEYLKTNLTAIAGEMHAKGDKRVHTFFYSRSYNNGCGGHPDMAQHQQIAAELTGYLRSQLGW